MAPPGYDPYGRDPRRTPYGQQTQVLTAQQIAKIEAAFEELNKKAAHWEQQAKQWQATATESQSLAGEWQKRVKELEEGLAAARAQAKEAQDNCAHWQEVASSADEQFAAWESRAGDYESVAAEAEQRVTELEEALQSAQQGHADEAERLANIQADFLESKQRLERRFAIQAETERKEFFRDLLPVLDNLDRALDHMPDRALSAEAEAMRAGVELTRQSFLKQLAGHGVQPVNPLGEPFDPELHEAVGMVPAASLPPGTVAAVEQKGYLIGDQLLRPARVLVTPM
jgi:molecular chaperone GrpE